MTGFDLRSVREDDAETIALLLAEEAAAIGAARPPGYDAVSVRERPTLVDDEQRTWLALSHGEPAGFASSIVREPGRSEAVVREPWRRRGLGVGLLRHAFGQLCRRGARRVSLGVDSENPSGATRLYERAGMHIEVEHVVFRKQLS